MPRPEMRLSDADRDEAIVRLSEHYAAGRLDKDEFDERSDAVWTARTDADLAPVWAVHDYVPLLYSRNAIDAAADFRVGLVPKL